MTRPRSLIAIAAIAACSAQHMMAQSEEDVLRFGSYLPGGTARSWALGSAVGAVGADPGSASTNPAGLALYNTSEFSFTPQFEVNNARSMHYGTNTSDSDNRFSFNNLSLILSTPYEDGGNWKSGAFGISFDRQASYHWDERAVGNNVPSTILQKFANEAKGVAPGSLADQLPFTSDLAYMTYGIDPEDTTGSGYITALTQDPDMDQDHRTLSSGRMNTTSFFYAANYNDRFYVGATMGLVGLRYERQTTHNETVLAPGEDLKDLSYSEKLITSGSGIDLKLGMIARVNSALRLGLAFHSPKWLQLSDAYNYSMVTNFNEPDPEGKTSYRQDSPDGSFDYRIRTPWSVLASAAYVVGQAGLVSVDYGYTDFRQGKLREASAFSDIYDFNVENEAMRNQFRGVHSVRVGTEWRSGAWYFRGGWGIWPSAYKDSEPLHGTAYMRFTGGIGYRTQHVSIDLTGVYGTQDVKYYQYDPALINATSVQRADTRGVLTIAFRP